MMRKTAGLAIGILGLLGLAATPASAAGTRVTDLAPPGCVGQVYDVFLGQGIALTCGYPPGGGTGYTVVAHCSNGSAFWFALGTFVPYGFAPSTAECTGGLLAPAWVGGYHVLES